MEGSPLSQKNLQVFGTTRGFHYLQEPRQNPLKPEIMRTSELVLRPTQKVRGPVENELKPI
jgi:hypothetical protein